MKCGDCGKAVQWIGASTRCLACRAPAMRFCFSCGEPTFLDSHTCVSCGKNARKRSHWTPALNTDAPWFVCCPYCIEPILGVEQVQFDRELGAPLTKENSIEGISACPYCKERFGRDPLVAFSVRDWDFLTDPWDENTRACGRCGERVWNVASRCFSCQNLVTPKASPPSIDVPSVVPPQDKSLSLWRSKPLQAVAVAAALLAIPYFVPALSKFKVMRLPFEKASEFAEEVPKTIPTAPPASSQELSIGATENKGSTTNALAEDKSEAEKTAQLAIEKAGITVKLEIEDASNVMGAFYTLLKKTDEHAPGSVTRIIHYGDSVLTSDLVSGTARRKFQARFGDAGHGFVLTANAWDWYYHNDVFHASGEGWSLHRVVGPWIGDGRYGPGAVSFQATGPASAVFGTATKGEFGKNVSRFDVYYLEQPQGADLELRVEEGARDPNGRSKTPQRTLDPLSTKGPSKVTKMFRVNVADGEARLSLKSKGNGPARVFGVALERDTPGVVYDAMGINGARASLLGEQMNGAHWKEVFDLRDPGLIVLHFGTNESEAGVVDPKYPEQLAGLIRKVKEAAPGRSVLVLSPIDRAGKAADGELRSKKVILDLVEIQARVAREEGVAFFNLFEAMGGKGTMAKWVRMNPPLGTMDYTHPTPAGGEVLGNVWFEAVMRGYNAFREKKL